jgi:hypothetical protein
VALKILGGVLLIHQDLRPRASLPASPIITQLTV